MIHRNEYMGMNGVNYCHEDPTIRFQMYYGQFVTQYMKEGILQTIGKENLKRAYKDDRHLNTIPLKKWDSMGYLVTCNRNLSKQMKECGDWLTPAGVVCILKEAARQIVEE